MKNTALLLAAAALITLPLASRAGDCQACPASKATTTTGTSSTCSSAKGQYVMLKVKNADADAMSKLFAKVDGVSAAETCCQSKFTKVTYDKSKVCTDKIFAALKDAGYKVQAQRVTLAVDGLACGSCCDQLSKALSKVKGVAETQVCHQSKQAVVDFDPNKITTDKILAAIDASGYKATEVVN